MKLDKTVIPKLTTELMKPLPGEDAQYRMAPSYRPRLSYNEIQLLHPKLSGVMLLLYEKDGELNIVFTQRKLYEGVHSGQMSFPGGKKDETDVDLTQTALRETKEEIGMGEEKIEIIGKLTELYIPPSNFLVYPSIGFAQNNFSFIPQQNEVEKVVEIPLDFFLNERNINLHAIIKLFNGTTVQAPAYIFNEHIIWGATAIMLSEFTFVLREALK